MPKGKKSKYVFTLFSARIHQVDSKYNFRIPICQETLPDQTTSISELNLDNSFDTRQNILKNSLSDNIVVSMVDITSKTNLSDNDYDCFWCRYKTTDCCVIGCPIRYIPNQVVKRYYSEISRNIRTIKENISQVKTTTVPLLNEDSETSASQSKNKFSIESGDYYETDGVFCSFNCCMAWINEHKHIRLYDSSKLLLYQMYRDIFKTNRTKIIPAPHWRLRVESGGHLTMAEFRKSLNVIEFDNSGPIVIPNQKNIGILYEEISHF